ncbi:MAG: hypothetical protein JRD19_03130 [Deltaproteobacteria bacterium]|nr:hypothetical protein [Deltaproteobacteria bacterium]
MIKTTRFQLVVLLATITIITSLSGGKTDSSHRAHLYSFIMKLYSPDKTSQ